MQESAERMRVVLDTNVIISAVLFGGKPRLILEAALAGHFELFLSDAMVDELHDVLRRPKFSLPGQAIQAIISELRLLAHWVLPRRHFDIVAEDPDDDRVIECAIEAEADYIVSGDRHLRKLGGWEKTRILSPEAFVEILEINRPS
ncbi:MAG: putative toxin-antitoxin system toxin component, PIN family [Rectinemataceae bacterium]